MKRILIFLTSLLTISAQAQTHDWENPAVLGINKLPYHATLQLPSKWKACKEIVSLDGDWQFRWSRNPEERTIDFYREDYDVSSCNGNRCDVRWFEIGSEKQTIHIDGKQPLCIRAWDYGEENLEGVRHPQDIIRGRFVNLNIDLNIHGVGGIDTWGRRTLPQYTIPGDQSHHLGFVMYKINAD